MGKRPKAKLRYGNQIKTYMTIMDNQTATSTTSSGKPRLELEVQKPSPGAKPRNPAAHPWRYTGQAKGRIFKDIDLVPFDRKVDVPYGVCFNCWQYNHQQGNCPKPTIDDHCQNCGRIGVKMSNCARCRRAYQVYRKKNKIQQAGDAETAESSTAKEKGKKESQKHEVSPAGFSTTKDDFYDEEPPYDEWDDFTKIIVDESMSAVITSDFLERFLNFVNAIKYLPAKDRTDIAQRYLLEHRRQLIQESLAEKMY